MKRWAVLAVILLFLMSYVVFSQTKDDEIKGTEITPGSAAPPGTSSPRGGFGTVFPDRPSEGPASDGPDPSLEAEYDRPPPSLEVFHIPADPTDADTINITANVIASVSLEKECIPSTGILSLFFGGCTETGNWIERTPNWRPRGIKIFVNGEERKTCGFDVNTMFRYCKKGS
ncbi:MAG: hypothetical protein HY368_00975, partial [Candidatus Aenigmarchaeota archaeon]|nr:hypothetical protein [Candidatus Aenigmarchaeota archaeon]